MAWPGMMRDAGTNKVSSLRVMMVVWFAGVLVVWAWVSFARKEVQGLPESVATILGVLVGGKAVQRFGED